MKKFLLLITFLLIVISAVIYQSPFLQNKIYSVLPSGWSQNIKGMLPEELIEQTKPLYKWKDKNGQFVISDTPPVDKKIPYETLQYNKNTNVIPPFNEQQNKKGKNKQTSPLRLYA